MNVLRTRIDRFGVVQPNIQSLEDKMGRIMVELPGIKEPERVRNFSKVLPIWSSGKLIQLEKFSLPCNLQTPNCVLF